MNLDFKEYNNIVIIGDLHSNVQEFVNSLDYKDTLIILCGDINLGKDVFENEIEMLLDCEYKLSSKNNVLCIIRGNHDNPKFFKKNSTFKTTMTEEAPHVFLLQDYSILNTKEHTILCIGGARSLDRINRIKDFSFWGGENVNKPSDNFYQNLFENNIKIDIVISHTAPLFAYPKEFTNENKYYNSYVMNSYAMYDEHLKNDVYKERLLLKGIYEKLNNRNQIKYWLYSHYHMSNEQMYNGTKMKSLAIKEKYMLDKNEE